MAAKRLIDIVKILVPCLLLYVLFISPSVHLRDKFKPDLNMREFEIYKNDDLSAKAQLLMVENQKAIEEIKQKQDHVSHWYELKFMFVGFIVLGFFAEAIFRSNKCVNESTSDKESLLTISKSPLTLGVLALAFIVSISVDMQIAAQEKMINQNGIWIAEFVEPAMMGKEVIEAEKHYDRSIVGWERFLRIGDKALHTSVLSHLTYYTYVFFLTILLYAFYLSALLIQSAEVDENNNKKSPPLRDFGFWVVHLALLACSFSMHHVPETYEVSILGFHKCSPMLTLYIYPVLCLILIGFTYFFILKHEIPVKKQIAEHG